jgi:hypothetical protein
MKCPICTESLRPYTQGVVLNKYPANFDFCDACGFLRIRNPYWLEESYSDAIALTDTGLVSRNVYLAKRLALLLLIEFGERGEGKYLDVAGGYGMLVRLMRDYGFDFHWQDKYCKNLLSIGFEHSDTSLPYNAVTAVEVMEHLEDPLNFVKASLAESMSDTFIFTTSLFHGLPPLFHEWPYYSLETGQHISFFQHRTLITIAEKIGMNFLTIKGIHIFTKKRINPVFSGIYCSSKFSMIAGDQIINFFLNSRTLADSQLMTSLLNRSALTEKF